MEQNNTTDKGFLMSQSAWDKLPLSQKAEMIKVAVKNGIYNLDTIRKEYNSFAESEKPSDDSYYSTMEKIAEENYKKWGFNTPDEALTHALNDNTYNYKGYYAKYPASKANADTHWTDEFKTVYHPTFSDESIYSGNVSEYNPQGLTGGHWEGETFIPAPWQKEHQYAKGGKKKTNASGKQAFLNTLDQSLQEDGRFNSPEWRRYFTELANVESGYSPNITNSIGAKGYFQLMPSNRSKTWTTPTQQFHEFYKFAGNNLDYLNKHLTKKDWERAKTLGIDIFGLMAGAHLGGVGGVVRALRGQGNAKDSNGTSVMSYMTRFSQSGKGSPYLGNNFSSVPVVRDVSPMSTFTPEQYNLIYGNPFADNNSLFPFETPTIAPYVAPDYSNLFSEVTPSTVDTSVADAYSKEQLAKEERANRLNALNLVLGNGLFGNPSDSPSNGLFDFALGDVASNPLMLVSSIYSNNNTFADGGPLVERANLYPIGGPLTNALARVRRAVNGSVIAASKAVINNSLNNMYQNTVGKYVFGNSSTEKPAANGALVGAKVGVPTTQVVNPDYTDLVDFLTADRNEGFLAEPTDIGDGKITIGSGLTNKKWLDLYKQRGNVWSKEDNRAAVLEEIKERSARLAKSLPNFNTLPLDSQKALISYDYNVGMSPNNHPNLWKAAKNKDWGTVANEMNATSKNPNFVKGLERRRKEEQDWFRRGFKAYGGNLYNDGGPKKVYSTDNYPLQIDPETGNIVDRETGDYGSIMLDDVVVTPESKTEKWSPYSWRSVVPFEYSRNSYYRPEDALEAFNTITFGGLNNLSPVQWGRRIFDFKDVLNGSMSGQQYWDRWINGNEGLVSGEYAREHPWATTAINGVADLATFLGGTALTKLPELRTALQAEELAAQDAVASAWEGIMGNGSKTLVAQDGSWTRFLPGKGDYSFTKWEPYSGYTATTQSPKYSEFAQDVAQGASWGRSRGSALPLKANDFSLESVGYNKIGNGAEAVVVEDPSNASRILKFNTELSGPSKETVLEKAVKYAEDRNQLPFNMPLSIEGAYQKDGQYFPVFSQQRVTPINESNMQAYDDAIGTLNNSVNGGMYYPGPYRPNNILLENNFDAVADFKPANLGVTEDGNVVGIDLKLNSAENKYTNNNLINYAFGPNSEFRVHPEEFSWFDDVDVDISTLPEYAKSPSKENLINAPKILDKRFNYRDWIERMEGRKISDEEFKTLRAKYPTDQKIIRDVDNWENAHVLYDSPNEAHVGKEGTQDPEIEGTITAHEKDHTYGIPELTDEEAENMFGFIWDTYLRKDSAAEMFARLGQVANWYGIDNIAKKPLTGDMLKYAASKGRYFKDSGFDNNMFDFFNILKMNKTWDTAANAYNKYGKFLLLPIAGNEMYKVENTNKNEK